MSIRLTGISSNMDTDSMVKELVKASSSKKEKLEKEQTKLGWKQTAWADMNTTISNFRYKFLDDMKYQGSYKKKSTTVADSSIATVVAGEGAVNGSQALAVTQLAKSGYLTGGKLSGGYTKNSTMKDLGALADGETASIDINGKTINFNSSTSIDNLITQMNKAGVNASFDATNQRFFVSAQKSGEAADFQITANDAKGLEALKSMKLLSAEDATNNSVYQEWIALGADTAAYNTKVAEEAEKRAKSFYDAVKALEADNEDLNTSKANALAAQDEYKTKEEYTNASNAKAAAGYTTDQEYIDFLTDKKTKIDRYNELNTMLPEERTVEQQAEYESLAAYSTQEFTDDDAKNLEALKTCKEYTSYIEGVNQTIDENNASIADMQTYYTTSGSGDTLTVTATEKMTDAVKTDFDARIAAATQAVADAGSIAAGTDGSVRILGADAKIQLNGAEFTSSSNSFSVNGLTITANSLSEETAPGVYKTTSVNTSDDVDGVYNMIKEFIKQYNTMINAMDSKYNAASAKGYEPLTSEEKDAMTDTEVSEWEKKIKDALLRRDGTLGEVTTEIKQSMMKSYTVNGEKLNLSSFGISTMSYFLAADNEKGAYHIDGDKDDSSTSGETDKLKTAIAENPEKVRDFFVQLAQGVSDTMSNLMRRTEFSSVNKVYNDKQMQTDYDDYTTKIKKQEEKLKDLEDRYYKQFTAMETAMTKLNSTQSYISSMFS